MIWYWIHLPYATFGIAVRDGLVVRAAPIAAWSLGKPNIIEYYRRKGATIKHLP